MKKKCTKCKVEKPMTTEYFSRMKDGFQFQCKECRKKYHTDKREEILRKRNEKYRLEHPLKHTVAFSDGMKLCCKCNELKPSTNEFFNNLKKAKDGFRHECRECRKLEYENDSERAIEKSRKYYEDNKEKVLLKTKKYKEENEEWYQEYNKSYYKENQELIKTRSADYYHDNKDEILVRFKAYRVKNKEILKLKKKKYNKNPNFKPMTDEEKTLAKRVYKHKREAAKNKLPKTLTKHQWLSTVEEFKNCCAYCGKNKKLAQDHFIPVSKGGEYTHNNIIPCCLNCNSSKSAKSFFDWYPNYKYYNKVRERKILIHLNYNINRVQQLSIL